MTETPSASELVFDGGGVELEEGTVLDGGDVTGDWPAHP